MKSKENFGQEMLVGALMFIAFAAAVTGSLWLAVNSPEAKWVSSVLTVVLAVFGFWFLLFMFQQFKGEYKRRQEIKAREIEYQRTHQFPYCVPLGTEEYRIWRAQEDERIEREHLQWCEPKNDAESILQLLCDEILNEYTVQLDSMRRIKVTIAPLSPDRCGQYNGRYIEIRDGYFYHHSTDIPALEGLIKHELVHAWKAWKGIHEFDEHGPIFQAKLRELC